MEQLKESNTRKKWQMKEKKRKTPVGLEEGNDANPQKENSLRPGEVSKKPDRLK